MLKDQNSTFHDGTAFLERTQMIYFFFFFSLDVGDTVVCPFIHCIHFFKLDVKFQWKFKQKASLWPKKTLSSLLNIVFLVYLSWRRHINPITQIPNRQVISNHFFLLTTKSMPSTSQFQGQYLPLKYFINKYLSFHPYYYYSSNSAVILYLSNTESSKYIIHTVSKWLF